MIEKMKFVSITGPKADIDRVTDTYLSRYEIHLENALSEFATSKKLSPILDINPYKDALTAVNGFYEELDAPEQVSACETGIEEALATVSRLREESESLSTQQKELESQKKTLKESQRSIRPFRNLDFDISTLFGFKHIHYHFGKIEKEYFRKFEQYIYDNLDTVFVRCDEDEQYVWGIYFAPEHEAHKVDAVYSSMHFEVVFVPHGTEGGTMKEAYRRIVKRTKELSEQIAEVKTKRQELFEKNKVEIVSARAAISRLSGNFDIRKLAACTQDEEDMFYILCGWMTETDTRAFQNDIKNDSSIFCIIDGEDENSLKANHHLQPPTKLKNKKLFKPFEMYISMYGLPAYNEMDPTWFVALTYSFIFGAMFGDVGQGLFLLIGGFLLYKFKGMALAGIISCAGFFSTIFGFLYGSIFGFEDVIPALWLRPMNAMTDVPFIGKLNTVFVYAIGFGMILILLCMIFNIINARKAKDTEKTWFDTNAVAGLVFYASLVTVVVLFMTGHSVPGGIVLFLMFGVPLILMFLKEPLTALVEKKSRLISEGKGMFLVQGFFEMFEVLLSYFSNTLSFVRIGAFAVSHAAMMEVVLMLAGAESGSPNWVVVVLGNLFVCGLEGLIVGIQVLRLEYYELFSRFYKGTGRKFEPFQAKGGKNGSDARRVSLSNKHK